MTVRRDIAAPRARLATRLRGRRLIFWGFDDVILEPGAPLGE